MIQSERHVAVVADSVDPESRGRIKVRSLSLLGSDDVVLHEWIEPCFDWGWFYVPNVGEQVEIEVVSGSDKDEVPGQAFLESPDYRWRGKRFYSTSQEVPSDFTSSYGKRRGFATPSGHVLIFDDSAGQESVILAWKNASGQSQQIELSNGMIKLGASATESVIKGTTYLAAMVVFLTALDTFIKTITPAPTGLAVFQAAILTFKAAVTAAPSVVSFTE